MDPRINFTVRVGIPGSLTIEIDKAPQLIQPRLQTISPPLRTPLTGVGKTGTSLGGDTQSDPNATLDRVWGQGWAVSVSKRLAALGGSTLFQLIDFESPSWDQTDNLWGSNGSIDATTDPVTFVGTPFGASIYGRVFQEGDFILWDDPTSSNGRYSYEIDQITKVQGNTFTLARRNPFANGAWFGSPMVAHAGVNFYQLIDKHFTALWQGEHQVFKFLWDDMIVAAVAGLTPGMTAPQIVNLAAVPPAAAVGGLAT